MSLTHFGHEPAGPSISAATETPMEEVAVLMGVFSRIAVALERVGVALEEQNRAEHLARLATDRREMDRAAVDREYADALRMWQEHIRRCDDWYRNHL